MEPPTTVRPPIPDYELLHPIGKGAYGEVWLARNLTGSRLAIKIVRRAAFDHDRPFQREFEGIQRFEPISRTDPGQVAILHLGRGEGFFYYVMELADPVDPAQTQSTGTAPGQTGERPSYRPRTLKYLLNERGALPAAECLAIATALTRALAHLHGHGLVHRDVKPSNVIFVNGVAKLADIGLVTGIEATRSFVGTEGYLPLEGAGTPQADLYSLGKVLYEMSTGNDRHQFPSLPPDIATRPDREFIAEFNAIVVKACATNHRERYASADAMHAELELLRSGQSVKSRRAWQSLGRRMGWIALLVSLLLAAIGSAWWVRDTPPASVVTPRASALETFETSGTTNRAAFDLYLLGRKAREHNTPVAHLKGIDYFEKAVALDARFARAYAEAADAWSRLDLHEHTAPSVCRPKSREAALKALAIDDSLVAAITALGNYKMYFEWDWEGAAQEFQRAARHAPDDPGPKAGLARLLSITGRRDEAIRILAGLQQNHPELMWINNSLGECYFFAGRYPEAEREIHKTLAIAPNDHMAHFRLAEILWSMGRYDESLSAWVRWSVLRNGQPGEFGQAHEAFRGAGLPGFWDYQKALNEKSLANRPPDEWYPAMSFVWVYAGTGELDQAFEWLDRACEEKQPLLIDIAVHPHYASLRPDPRFQALLTRMGLAPYFPSNSP